MDVDIYLASASPRRRELLVQIGLRFEILKVDVPEIPAPHEQPQDFVQRLALEKARAGRRLLAPEIATPVLGADTAVVVDGQILGKPANQSEALQMLDMLSGRSHKVMSGVALVAEREAAAINITSVTFRQIDQAERWAYWATGECADKAGAYAIQGHAAAFISHLNGSYSGVMGLPLFETASLLQEFGINLYK